MLHIIPKSTTTISAMDLRKEAGRFLDRVDLRGETFVVERAGKAKAAIVPIQEYEQLRRIKQEAKERLFVMMDELHERTAHISPEILEKEIEEAIVAVRRDSREA